MSNPYFRFATQRRYPYQWGAGQGGVMPSGRSAEARELSGDPILESGATAYSRPFPALQHTRLHDLGSLRQARPAGYEPIINDEVALGLSDMERKGLYVAGAAAVAYFAWRRMQRKGRRR